MLAIEVSVTDPLRSFPFGRSVGGRLACNSSPRLRALILVQQQGDSDSAEGDRRALQPTHRSCQRAGEPSQADRPQLAPLLHNSPPEMALLGHAVSMNVSEIKVLFAQLLGVMISRGALAVLVDCLSACANDVRREVSCWSCGDSSWLTGIMTRAARLTDSP